MVHLIPSYCAEELKLLSMPCSSNSPSCGGGNDHDHGRRDWSNLQYDLLFCIAGKLTTIDYITFRAVCRSWSSAVPEIPPYAPHAPYLLLGPERNGERNGDNGDVPAGTETDIFNFLSIPDSTLHRFRIPKLVGKNCVGSQYGWLVTNDRARGELALLNPFTGQEILLPPIKPLVGPMPRIVDYANNQIAVVKAVLSADPADGTALVVVAILFVAFERRLIFTRVGDCKWHYFGNQDHYYYYYYYDVMFDPRGMRLLATAYGDRPHMQLIEIDVGSEEITTFVLDPHSINILGHLAAYDVDDDDSGGGGGSGLLYVSRHHSFHSRPTTHFKIYEAEMDHQERRSKMTLASLGGRALFVGAGSSVSVSAADVRRLKLKANHVYFTKNMCFQLNLFSCSCGDDLGIYNLEEQDISFLIKRDERSIDTIDDRRSWLPPIWVSPSLQRRPTA